MPSAAPAPLLCPACRYDLAGFAAEQGACPECGQTFSKAALARRHDKLMSFVLALIGFGGIGVLVAEAAGAAIAHLPRANDGIAGSAHWATRLLGSPPLLIAAAGIALLFWLIGRSAVCRWAAGASAVLLGASIVCLLGSHNSTWFNGSGPWWSHLHTWRNASEWLRGPAAGLVLIVGAVAIRRLAIGGIGRFALAVQIAAAVAIVLDPVGRFHLGYAGALEQALQQEYYQADRLSQPGSPPPQLMPPSFVRSRAMSSLITFTAESAATSAWFVLGISALVIRTVRRAERGAI